VPVIGYQTEELPAFYSRSSGLRLDLCCETPEQVATVAAEHWQMGFASGVLVVAPVPVEDEVPASEMKDVIDEALRAATEQGISGKAVTPFLLSRIAERTEGRTLKANIALLRNNARIAGEIACALTEQEY
jgi:pseudouridine-5'-phosphate glycosidase